MFMNVLDDSGMFGSCDANMMPSPSINGSSSLRLVGTFEKHARVPTRYIMYLTCLLPCLLLLILSVDVPAGG
jgi:hypothetical protein